MSLLWCMSSLGCLLLLNYSCLLDSGLSSMVLKFSRFPADSFEELSWVISWVFLSNFRERPWLACTPLFGLQRLLLRLADLADWLVSPVAPLVFSELLLLLATHRLVIRRCMVVLVVAATPWMVVLLVLVGVNFGSTPITSVAIAALVVAILVTSTASATVFTLVDGSRIGIVMLVVA